MTRDVDYEHEPAERGACREHGNSADYPTVARLQQDVEVHGECHAQFEELDAEIEVRLRTAVFNYDDGLIEIWDGDNYEPYSMDSLVGWYQPMAVEH